MTTVLDQIVLDAVDPVALGGWWSELLGWPATLDADGDVELAPPTGEPGVPLLFCRVDDAAAGSQRLHLDLSSGSPAEQRSLVARAEAVGARPVDIGQGDTPWVVLADPEGGLFCVLEPRPEYDDAGPVAAVVVETLDPAAAARFWAAATGWDITRQDRRFASLRAPGGAGPALEFLSVDRLPDGKNRVHLDVAPTSGPVADQSQDHDHDRDRDRDRDRDAAVARLVTLGARPLDVGQEAAPGAVRWVVLADPEGAAFCVLRPGP
jgi:predicted enzyme related to lactoylglutathione lyase